tara:strand:+ start:91061 stop:91420 length:360 start_codon:yes stop_codon:yes gene_type:complete
LVILAVVIDYPLGVGSERKLEHGKSQASRYSVDPGLVEPFSAYDLIDLNLKSVKKSVVVSEIDVIRIVTVLDSVSNNHKLVKIHDFVIAITIHSDHNLGVERCSADNYVKVKPVMLFDC